MKPSVRLNLQVQSKHSNQLIINVDTPNFAYGQSEVLVQVYQIEDAGILSPEHKFRVNHKDWKITQKEGENSKAIEGFIYSIPFLSMWPSKGYRVEWRVKVQYRLDKNVTLPYVDIDERNEWEDSEVPDKAWIIKEIEYA